MLDVIDSNDVRHGPHEDQSPAVPGGGASSSDIIPERKGNNLLTAQCLIQSKFPKTQPLIFVDYLF